jgi:hypothetical protein
MNIGTSEAWIADVDEVETQFDTDERLAAHVSEVEQQAMGRLWILIDRGPMTGWRRWLGAKRDVTPCLSVEWDYGAVVKDFWADFGGQVRKARVSRASVPPTMVQTEHPATCANMLTVSGNGVSSPERSRV